ncbi:hypothetical protein [Paenibacillus tyrfis]|uniref:hypothetical protein n=1 Tax=Paenibacillus tyrfis TaxID=1501230 RepID=UPI00209F1FF4|nr:hypothetical protein [Paenibacillus tyrfis]MCP1305905.1 hypothetical protein [Paenibacillus tyrfis]
MNISGLIRGLAGDAQAAEPKALELKVGQVVKGMVLQVGPEQDAVVNIGGVQVRAQLEAPLKPGEVTMLQVQPESSGGQVVLKPLQSSVQISDGSLADIVKTMGLPDSPANRQLVQLLHQAGVTLTKENVQAFAKLQAQMPPNMPQEAWLSSAVIAFQKGLPLTPETVASVRQAVQGPPFHEVLDQLGQLAGRELDGNASLSPQSRELLQNVRQLVQQLRDTATLLIGAKPNGGEGTPAGAQPGASAGAGAQAGAQPGAGASAGAQAAAQPGASAGAGAQAAAQPGAGAGAAQAVAQPGAGAGAGAQAAAQPGASAGAGAAAGQPGASAGAGAQAAAQPGASAGAGAQAAAQPGASAGAGAQAAAQPGASAGAGAQAAAQPGVGAGAGAQAAAQPGAGAGAGAQAAAQPGASAGAGAQAAAQPGAGAGAGAQAAAQPGAGAGAGAQAAAQPGAGAGAGAQAAAQPGASAGPGAQAAAQPGAGAGAGAPAAAQPGAGAGAGAQAAAQPGASAGAGAQAAAQPVQAPQEGGNLIGRLMKTLGIEHEHQAMKLLERTMPDAPQSGLSHASVGAQADFAKSADTLKSLLMQLSQASDAPQGLKDAAQQAVQQITGQQLMLSADRNAMLSHLTLFVPIMHAGGEQTAAVHIQSRKGKNGSLDASNCRLVFDLRMKMLGDTMVDVQVVNGIVSLHVHNDSPFTQELLEAHKEEIAAGLASIGYQFISMKYSPYPTKAVQEGNEAVSAFAETLNHPGAGRLPNTYSQKPYKGMDIRI